MTRAGTATGPEGSSTAMVIVAPADEGAASVSGTVRPKKAAANGLAISPLALKDGGAIGAL